ncbi:hypothetical protein JC221_120 [Yersinia phage JC221]|nr:hypothetical protein JC221_120 [Yersinia phage JC221]
MNRAMQVRRNNNISKVVGCEVLESEKYDNGFSFCVKTELDAYKAAYKYRTMPMVNVLYSENVKMWVVQVYNKV